MDRRNASDVVLMVEPEIKMVLFSLIFGTFLWLLGSWIFTECYERFIRDKSKKRQYDEEVIVGMVAAFWPFSLPFLVLAWLAWRVGKFLLDWGEVIVREMLKSRTNGTGAQ